MVDLYSVLVGAMQSTYQESIHTLHITHGVGEVAGVGWVQPFAVDPSTSFSGTTYWVISNPIQILKKKKIDI